MRCFNWRDGGLSMNEVIHCRRFSDLTVRLMVVCINSNAFSIHIPFSFHSTQRITRRLEKIAMAVSELACTYAALILHDDNIPITADKINTLVKAAGITVEAYWPGLFAKLLERRSVDDIISSVGSGGGGAVAAAPAAGGGAADAPVEEEKPKKEEEKEESDDDMGFSLFD